MSVMAYGRRFTLHIQGVAELPQVFDNCFRAAASPSDHAGPDLPCDSVAAFVVEDQNEHSKQMGRCRADTAHVLRLDQFWNVIGVSHAARVPLQRFHLFCQQRFGDGPDEKDHQELLK